MPTALPPASDLAVAAAALADQRLRGAFARGRPPRVAAIVPAIVAGGTLAGAERLHSPSDAGRFRYPGGAAFRSPYADWVGMRTVTYSADGADAGQVGGSVEFMSDAPQLVLNVVGNGSPYRLWVDGELIAPLPSVSTYTDATKPLIDWTGVSPAPTVRRYRVDVGAGGRGASFAGIGTDPRYDVWAPTALESLRCVVAGDSFTDGVTADGTPSEIAGLTGFANYLGWRLGIDDLWCSGSGGTGWLRPNGARIALPARFDRDVIEPAPDLAVLAMGINDDTSDAGAIAAAVGACVGRFRSALPQATLFVLLPWAPQGGAASAVRAGIAAGAGNPSGRTFLLDTMMSGHEWQAPMAGRVGAPGGTGNSDWVVDTGGTHPTIAGHAYLAARLADAMRAALAGPPARPAMF